MEMGVQGSCVIRSSHSHLHSQDAKEDAIRHTLICHVREKVGPSLEGWLVLPRSYYRRNRNI